MPSSACPAPSGAKTQRWAASAAVRERGSEMSPGATARLCPCSPAGCKSKLQSPQLGKGKYNREACGEAKSWFGDTADTRVVATEKV